MDIYSKSIAIFRKICYDTFRVGKFRMRREESKEGTTVCLCIAYALLYYKKVGRKMYDVCIVGCGVIGAATAFELSKYQLKTLVLEKENDIAMGATRANSAIIHAGYDPKPDTLMAKLNVKGNLMTEKLCKDLSVPFNRIGSLVLAFSEEEMNTVRDLYDRGNKNGVPDMRILSKEEVLQKEPMVSDKVVGALFAPSAGIITPWEYALAMCEVAVTNGVTLKLNNKVTDIKKEQDAFTITTDKDTYKAKYVINAAGVESDLIHNMVAEKTFTVLPNRGEYYLMDKCEIIRADHVLFQCPNKDGKGVLVSPTMDGNLIVGPNAVAVDSEKDTDNTAEGLNFVRQHALKSVPSLNFRNSIRNFSGVRSNTDHDEFMISIATDNFLDLAGIKSPGLSSAPAIAEYAVDLLKYCGMPTEKNASAVTTRKKVCFRRLNEAQKKEVIKQNPLFGRVICRCETITEGEIVEAIHSPITPCSVDGIKRRTGAGMGRCQGGFCGPRVLDILAREKHISPMDVLQDGEGSKILLSKTKQEDSQNV